MEYVDKMGGEGWNGLSFNLLMADREGDIAYMMLAPVPIRKDKTPYSGCRVLDGRKSDSDWEVGRNVPLTDLPRSYNPEKGYIVTANNKVTSDNAKFDYGATMVSTPRSIRITEMIKEQIKNEEKFIVEDMTEIQQDLTDVFARDSVPLMIKIASHAKSALLDE